METDESSDRSPVEKAVPGAPSSEPAQLEEPAEPRGPLPPKPDQKSTPPVSPTGKQTAAEESDRAQQGAYLTTAQGVRLYDTDHSLKAGPRGPVLMQDHHLREKLMHFDHERIPMVDVGQLRLFVRSAGAVHRCCCCTVTLAPRRPGIGSRHVWFRRGSPSCALTYPDTADPVNPHLHPTTVLIPSGRGHMT